MEGLATAQPWQIAVFIGGCLVFAVALIVWLMTGVRHDSEPVTLDPIVLAGQLWADILNWRPVDMSSGEGRDAKNDWVRNRPETPAPNRTNEPPNPPNLALQSGSLPLISAFVLNPQEAAAVGRMIEHKTTAEKPTKASIIWAGFGIKKGDSARYKRASEIYDTLFVLQPDFPALEANRQPQWEPERAA